MKIDQQKLNIFYDEMCGICDKLIKLLVYLINPNILQLYSLQNAIQDEKLRKEYDLDLSSIVVITQNKKLIKSKAIFYLLKQTKLKYIIKVIEFIMPQCLSDWTYDFIAKHRDKICKLKRR
ncbi:unnamed protein product [Paramecium pentaurelia]|uniref:DUF393 domain-containing protein n=1 Tax=Paramecium pentaurelia TaxID=43138 RepID=A0A8S1T4R8_9CILI|nr:unnamed protein product [Paramecium pentaurelia]